jgi:hypothetical protein
MADTGYNWQTSWSAMPIGAGDWTDKAVNDSATDTGDALDCDGTASVQVSVTAVEDNTGSIDGVVTVYFLRDCDGTHYETPSTASYAAAFTPVQNSTVYWSVALDCSLWNKFKVACVNEAGQQLVLSVKYLFATVPAAS